VAKKWRWHKRRFYEGGTNVVFKKVALTSFFICRWHLCRFLPIGGTNVDLIEGGTNVAVGVAKTSLGKNVGSTKVASPCWTNRETSGDPPVYFPPPFPFSSFSVLSNFSLSTLLSSSGLRAFFD
jgi:hypothetical protein